MAEFLLIRHARTELNDPANERIRGYSDVGISRQGRLSTEATRDFLLEKGFPIRRILSSPLQRAMQTAYIIGENRAKLVPNKGLSPWNLGALDETLVKESAPKMNYLQEFPDVKAPNGESYREFYTRWGDTLEMMKFFAKAHLDECLVGVCHSRNVLALESLLGDREIGNVPVKGGPGPESVTRVYENEDGDWSFEIIWEKDFGEVN